MPNIVLNLEYFTGMVTSPFARVKDLKNGKQKKNPVLLCLNPIASCIYTVLSCVNVILSYMNHKGISEQLLNKKCTTSQDLSFYIKPKGLIL